MSRFHLRTKVKQSVFIVLAFVMTVSVVPPVAMSEVAEAAPASCTPFAGWPAPYNGWYNGYFTGQGFTCDLSQLFAVLEDGLPASVDTKDEFRDYIKNLNATSGADRSNAYNDRNYVGTSYIIQTMRGVGDTSFPDSADIADWEARINNPEITVAQDNYSAGINSARMATSPRDATSFHGDGVGYWSLIFWYRGAITYVVKYICANPLGNLSLPEPSNFDLNPVVNGTPNYSEAGGTVSLTPSVNNTGSTSSTSAQWQLNQFNVPPASPLPGGATNGTLPPAHYGYGASTIASGNQAFGVGLTPIATGPRVLPDLPVGTRICYALSVQPVSHASSDWRHSNPFCVTIAKSPKLTVTGGDVLVGKGATSNIVTSTNRKNVSGADRTFGSWGEYAVAASGSISGMASGGGYSAGNPSSVFCAVSYLTITNAGTGSCSTSTPKGSYGMAAALPDISARFSQATPAGANPTFNAATQTGVYSATGNITVNSSGTTNGTLVINAPTGIVTIRDNITYNNGPFTRINDLPQVVIIADRINIEGDVGQIDAWLIASGANGTIVTCSDVAVANLLRSTNCVNRLTVNGPVMARHLLLYRTAGSGTGVQSSDPAEVFNLRPDAYLWATNYNAGSKRIQTLSTKELPPRF